MHGPRGTRLPSVSQSKACSARGVRGSRTLPGGNIFMVTLCFGVENAIGATPTRGIVTLLIFA